MAMLIPMNMASRPRSKISKGFQLQQTKLFNSVEVIHMVYFLFVELMCLNILMD